MRSARNGTEPLRTPTATSPSAWSAAMASPRRRQMSASSAGSAIDSSGAQAGWATSGREVVAQVGSQQRGPQVVAQLGQRAQQLDRLLAGLGVALLEQGHDHLLEEAGLSLGGDLVHPQVPGLDAVAEERRRLLVH